MHGQTAAEAAAALTAVVADAEGGSMRIFGDWIGKPFDLHVIPRAARAEGDELIVTFDHGEELRVSGPMDWQFGRQVFRIGQADAVVWQSATSPGPDGPVRRHSASYRVDDHGEVRVEHDPPLPPNPVLAGGGRWRWWRRPIEPWWPQPSTGSPAVELVVAGPVVYPASTDRRSRSRRRSPRAPA